jgi:hypothetical protein
VKRRTLDLIFSVGGIALVVLLVVLGLVLRNQANFAKGYVRDQLSAQQITFTPADKLSDEERSAGCLVDNAGQQLNSGKQAECYANRYIGLHVSEVNDGKTYSQTSNDARVARTKADAALKVDPNDPAAKDLDSQAKALAAKTETLFRGETLRGLLLTSYGFSIFGERADLAAWVCLLVALVLALASAAGLVHAVRTPRDAVVLGNPSTAESRR